MKYFRILNDDGFVFLDRLVQLPGDKIQLCEVHVRRRDRVVQLDRLLEFRFRFVRFLADDVQAAEHIVNHGIIRRQFELMCDPLERLRRFLLLEFDFSNLA